VLGSLGPAAEAAVPTLVRALESEHAESLRWSAAEALGCIGATEAAPELAKMLEREREPSLSFVAARALARLDPASEQALRSLVRALGEESRWLRWDAANALRDMGPAARAAVPALARALHDEDYLVRIAAAGALGAMGSEARSAVPDLMKAVADDGSCAAAKALGQIGPAAREAIPVLERAARDLKRATLSSKAGEALEKIRAVPYDAPDFEIRMKKPEDSLRVEVGPGSVSFEISCPSGIGSATIRRTRGRWPGRLLVRLPFETLEHFTVENGRMTLVTALRRGGKAYRRLKPGEERNPGEVYKLPIRRKEDHLEAELPNGFMAPDAETLIVGWIDAYR
jgi:hypothetical protein